MLLEERGSELHSDFLLNFPPLTLGIMEKAITLNIICHYMLLPIIMGHLLFYMVCDDQWDLSL